MTNWAEVLEESSIANYQPLDETDPEAAKAIFEILATYLPKNCKWKSVWCDGEVQGDNAANDLADALLTTEHQVTFRRDLASDAYIRGAVGHGYGEISYIRWGIGCLTDSGCDEILVPEYQHD